jgi:hypothetical protein
MDDPLKKRRQLLQAAGVGSATFLAGCSGFLGSEDEETDGDDPTDEPTETDPTDEPTDEMDNQTDGNEQNNVQSGDGDAREVGMVAQPDQEAMAELQQQLQAGEIERQEAVERQQELVAEGVTSLADRVTSETNIEVTAQLDSLGAIRANGAPGVLLDVLEYDQTTALVPASELQAPEGQPPGGG